MLKYSAYTGLLGKVGDPGTPYDPIAEMKTLSSRPLKYDNNRTALDVTKSAAFRTGVSPSLLYSSAFQEGMNKAIARPQEVSDAYVLAGMEHYDNKTFRKPSDDYPVDGFYNYGLDTFGDKYERLKKYLPAGFEQQFKTYQAKNEKGQPITTAAFRNNESALMAKAAMLKDSMQSVDGFAKKKGIALDEKAKNYFTLVAYNAGEDNADRMMDKYAKAKDKKAFLEHGDKNWQKVHNHISPRIKSMAAASEYLK